MSSIMSIGPASGPSGHIISTTGNVEAAMMMVVKYLSSTYDLEAADTILEQQITSAEAQEVQQFEANLTSANGPKNYIYQIEQLVPGSPDYSTRISQLTTEYTDVNAQNQSLVKVMDGNNSTAQNTLSQNSQGQQGVIQTLNSINGVAGNLSRLIQG